MRPAELHLNPQEFELLLFGVAESSDSSTDATERSEAQEHLDRCAFCQIAAERCRNADEVLKNLEGANKAPLNQDQDKDITFGSECPVEQSWLLVAARLIKEGEARRYAAHAAACDWCGPLLKEAMEDIAQDITREEERVLETIPSASPTWKREMARKLAAMNTAFDVTASAAPSTQTSAEELTEREKEIVVFRSKPKISIFQSARRLWAVASMALLATAFWITWSMTREPDINLLLAQAYTERRTIQFRISGVKYSPIQTERGSRRSHYRRPASLLNAESSIREGLRKSPEDQVLVEQKGRAELLDGDYKSAILTLQHAKDLSNANPMVIADLAAAYFERADAEVRQTDYETAAELLSIVLYQNPDDEIALFDRAMVYERLLLYEKAVNDWERYLHVTRDKGWDVEAEQYLDRLKQQLRQSNARTAHQPL